MEQHDSSALRVRGMRKRSNASTATAPAAAPIPAFAPTLSPVESPVVGAVVAVEVELVIVDVALATIAKLDATLAAVAAVGLIFVGIV